MYSSLLVFYTAVTKHLTGMNSTKERFILAYGDRVESIVAGKATGVTHGCGYREAACQHVGGPGTRGHASP